MAGVRHVLRAAEWGKAKYAGSWAEDLWRRLDVVDFMNQAMLLAATLLLCFVPFLLVLTALAGRSIVPELSWRLGLSKQAGADLGHLFTSASATSAAVTGLSWVFFILAGSPQPPRSSSCTSGCSTSIPAGHETSCAR